MARGSYVSADGYDSTYQGTYLRAKSLGTERIYCDYEQSLINWWGVRQGEQQRLDPVPRDENGVPYLLCSNGHYSPRRAFNKDRTRASGYDHYCRACREEQRVHNAATAKTPPA